MDPTAEFRPRLVACGAGLPEVRVLHADGPVDEPPDLLEDLRGGVGPIDQALLGVAVEGELPELGDVLRRDSRRERSQEGREPCPPVATLELPKKPPARLYDLGDLRIDRPELGGRGRGL